MTRIYYYMRSINKLRATFVYCRLFHTFVQYIQHNLIFFRIMTTSKKSLYLAPEVEILEVAVEFGFSSSIEDPIEDPEQDW